MNTGSPLFLIPVLVGPVLILAGIVLRFFPPKSINILYGYRTHKSMKSQAHWDFAQRFAAKELMIWGIFYTSTCFLSLFDVLGTFWSLTLSLSLMILLFVILIYRTEKAIDRQFKAGS